MIPASVLSELHAQTKLAVTPHPRQHRGWHRADSCAECAA